MNAHDLILDALIALDYATDKSGYCSGLTMRWLEAAILAEEAIFDARIQLINTLGTGLKNSIQAAKEKKGINLTDNDKKILDIAAFFDSAELYQNPSLHTSLYNKALSQTHKEELSAYASCEKIMEMGGIIEVSSELGIYSGEELDEYLNGLRTVIDSISPKTIVKILLSSINHATALTYEPGVGWKYMDINYYPPRLFLPSETKELTNAIGASNQTFSPYRELSFKVLTTSNDEQLPLLKDRFADFKAQHNHILQNQILRERDNITFAYFAAQNGDADLIEKLANHEVDLNKKTHDDGDTPVLIAAKNGHTKVIAALANHEANMDIARTDGVTPAIIAAQEGHAEVIAELANHGADLNKAMNGEFTPAYIAAQMGHTEVIAELAKHGADLNKANNNGATPAFIAAQYGHVRVIAELAKYGADLLKATNEGITPAFIAAQMGHTEVIAELAKHGVDLNEANDNGATPAFIAAQMGHAGVIAELTKYGADLLKATNEGITPAFIAAQMGHTEVIAKLAKHGVDLNEATKYGATPALIAAEMGHTKVIVELAKHGVDLNKALNNGATPAYIGAQEGHAEVIAELASLGADLNKALNDGTTPAYIAAQYGHVRVIAELAKHGADLNKATNDGRTPAFIAAQNGDTSVIVELFRLGADFSLPYRATESNLRAFSRKFNSNVVKRISDFILTKKIEGEDELISITPYDIAVIMMEHHSVSQRLQEFMISSKISPSACISTFFSRPDTDLNKAGATGLDKTKDGEGEQESSGITIK